MQLPQGVASPHQVQIRLDHPDTVYGPGHPISGRILVTGAQRDAGELRVEIHGYTRGRYGQGFLDVLASALLYNGPWEPGVQTALRFSIEAPRCVSRYEGQLFTLQTRLAAVTLLDSQGRYKHGVRRKPAAYTPISITYDTRPLAVLPDTHPIGGSPEGCVVGCNLGCAVLGGAMLGALALVLTGMLPRFLPDVGLVDGSTFDWVFAGIALLLFLVGSFGVYQSIRVKAIARAVGRGQLTYASNVDQGIALAVEVQLDRLDRVSAADAILSIREDTRTYVGRNENGGPRFEPDRHVLAEHTIALAHDEASQRLTGTLPHAAVAALPPSLGNHRAQVTWHLATRLRLRGSPDLTYDTLLVAAPGGVPFDSVAVEHL
jgi:hypothetical protein